ncbi:MAG: hypothetical protein P4L59_13635 [Desulfosporosinus sp.]|nr:hypothetical protein [Desulfosporosinus sp.]
MDLLLLAAVLSVLIFVNAVFLIKRIKKDKNIAWIILKKSLVTGIAVLLFLSILGIWNYVKISNLHRPIKAEDISSITLWNSYVVHKEATLPTSIRKTYI